jgi:hypothetical protein
LKSWITAHDGNKEGMYVMGENPAMSDLDANHARAGLANLGCWWCGMAFSLGNGLFGGRDFPRFGVARKKNGAPSPAPIVWCSWDGVRSVTRRCRQVMDHPAACQAAA